MKPRLVDAHPEADFERGHFAGAVSLAPDAVLVFAERELPLKSRALLVYGVKPNNEEAVQQTVAELQKLGFENVEAAPFGFDEHWGEFALEVGPARWEILGCGG